MLDQIADGDNLHETGFDQLIDKAQTFTVGLAGYLTRVDVKLHTAGGTPVEDVLFDIRTTAAGVPTEPDAGANILFSAVIPKTTVPFAPIFGDVPWTTVDLGPASFLVAPGDVLAICLRSEDPNTNPFFTNYWLAGNWMNPYASGKEYYRYFGNQFPQITWTNDEEDYDFFFRTYVDAEAPAVPEPASVLLFGSALAGLAGMRRKLRKGASPGTE
jgi:hypothetical protein